MITLIQVAIEMLSDDTDEEECNWQQERKLHFEDQLNSAKLKLLQEEDSVEKLKVDETKLTKRLKKECKLMGDKGKAQLLVQYNYITIPSC